MAIEGRAELQSEEMPSSKPLLAIRVEKKTDDELKELAKRIPGSSKTSLAKWCFERGLEVLREQYGGSSAPARGKRGT